MTRAAAPTLKSPADSRLVADFTNGSIPSAAVVFDSGPANSATGRAYTYDSRGIGISFTGGATGNYASAKWEPHQASPGATINLAGSEYFSFEAEWPEGTGAVYDTIAVFIVTQTGSVYTNFQNRTPISGADKTPKRQIINMRLTKDTWTLGSGGPSDFATIGKIEFRLGVHASAQNIPANVFIRKIWIGRNRPKVMITFDDSMDGQINYAYPSLQAAGFKASLFVSPSQVGQAGRLTKANLQTMYAAGWDMGCQQYNDSADIPVNFAGTTGLTNTAGTATWVNPGNIPHLLTAGQQTTIRGAMNPALNGTVTVLSTPNAYTFTYAVAGAPLSPDPGWATCPRLTKADAQSRFLQSKEWLRSNGFSRGNDFIAYSNGVTDEEAENWFRESGFLMGRTTRLNIQAGMDPRQSDPKALMRMSGATMDQQTSATILGYIDTCILYGRSIILYGHDIDPTPAALTITQSVWDAIIAGLVIRQKQGAIDAGVTVSEFYQSLRLGRVLA